MHAYVISSPAMRQLVGLEFNSTETGAPQPKPIDTELEMRFDHGRFFTVYPMFAFQVTAVEPRRVAVYPVFAFQVTAVCHTHAPHARVLFASSASARHPPRGAAAGLACDACGGQCGGQCSGQCRGQCRGLECGRGTTR